MTNLVITFHCEIGGIGYILAFRVGAVFGHSWEQLSIEGEAALMSGFIRVKGLNCGCSGVWAGATSFCKLLAGGVDIELRLSSSFAS